MKKKGGFKKHLFWILFGVVPFLVFLCVILLLTDDSVEAEEKKFADSKKVLDNEKPKGKGLSDKLAEQQKTLETTGNQLWKANYDRQVEAKVFRWPVPPTARHTTVLKAFESRHTKFGEELKDEGNDELEKFAVREVYEKSYELLAEEVAPTRFGTAAAAAAALAPASGATGPVVPGGTGGWQSVLRYVSDWSKKPRPDSAMVWLMLEDYWIQKALLDPVRQINLAISEFHLVVRDGNKKLVPYDSKQPEPPSDERTFVNRTWEITLKVVKDGSNRLLKSKLRNRTDRLQLLGIGKTMRLKVWLDDPNTSQPIDYKIEGELVKGETEMDVKLVPAQHTIPANVSVSKITKVEQVLDELTVPVRLIQDVQLGVVDHKRTTSTLLAPEFLPADATPAIGAATTGGAIPPLTSGDPMGLPGSAAAKTGTPEQVLIGNMNRYLVRTPRIRRMSVGIVLVLDQAYMEDALVAFANSPLRFQVSQVQWSRFRDPLPVPTGAVVPGGADGDVKPPMPVGGQPMPIPGGPGALSAVTTQTTAGMVELGIFGIVSLYEKFDPTKDGTGKP